jgi:hypothetical protein
MKISYNPYDVNSLTIGAIKFAKNPTATLAVVDTKVNQTPKEFMEKNYPGERVPLVVHILSTPNDDRHKALCAAVKIRLSKLDNSLIFAWKNLFDNDLTDVTRLIEAGANHVEAIDWIATSLQKSFKKPVAKKKPVKKPVKKVVKKPVVKKPAKKAGKKK